MLRPKRIEPGPGQESVWDYPRPPRLEEVNARIRVVLRRVVIADTRRAQRVLETSHPPNYYIPPDDINMRYLVRASGSSICEWKGPALYYAVDVGNSRIERAAWSYPLPTNAFAAIRGYVAFYAAVLECYVDEERVAPQPGGFYGGWITRNIVGPFKGAPGTMGW